MGQVLKRGVRVYLTNRVELLFAFQLRLRLCQAKNCPGGIEGSLPEQCPAPELSPGGFELVFGFPLVRWGELRHGFILE
jgi:hypothetical protein